MATHTREELRAAARTLGRAALQAGFRPGAGVPVAAAVPAGHPEERVVAPLAGEGAAAAA
jgi:glycine C-acetyltransferase/8-amino-7-oxononanoate synthase